MRESEWFDDTLRIAKISEESLLPQRHSLSPPRKSVRVGILHPIVLTGPILVLRNGRNSVPMLLTFVGRARRSSLSSRELWAARRSNADAVSGIESLRRRLSRRSDTRSWGRGRTRGLCASLVESENSNKPQTRCLSVYIYTVRDYEVLISH